MPFQLYRSAERFVLTMTGTISQEDLMGIATQVAEAEDSFPAAPNRLIDMTGIESMGVGLAEVMALAAQRRKRHYPNEFKSAFLVSSEVQKGYARMFQTLNDHPSMHLEIFTDRGAAEAWLKAPL